MYLHQTAATVANALSAVESIGNVTVAREDASVTTGSASWTYTIDFDHMVGDVEELTIISSEMDLPVVVVHA